MTTGGGGTGLHSERGPGSQSRQVLLFIKKTYKSKASFLGFSYDVCSFFFIFKLNMG